MNEDEEFDEGLEEYDEDEELIQKPARGKGRPKKVQEEEAEEAEEEEKVKEPILKRKPRTVRYEAFHQTEVVGVRDAETGEVIAQGFTDQGSAMAFADTKNNLWKIEKALGSL